MAVDIFSSFDYLSGLGMGGKITGFIFFWGSSVLLLLFHFGQFSGVKLNRGEVGALWVAEMVFSYVYKSKESSNVLRFPGAVGVLTSMFLCLLWFNVLGLIPGIYAITRDFYVGMVFSFTMWSTGVMMFWSPFWVNLVCHLIIPVESSLLRWLLTVAESVSLVARAFTLVLRLGFNIIAGEVVFFGLSSKLHVCLQSGMPLKGLFFMLFLMFFTVWELFIGLFQAFLFVFLNVLYVEEIPFSG
nr:ATP synthase F0 subunit 6 [Mya arenaria]